MFPTASDRYRPEIDGLRSIAVLSVVLYHAGLGFPRAGFLGVDVFFAISGYLITGLILHEVRDRKFSILKFYERRARRILPALLVMIALAIPVAYALMIPDELKKFGESVIATILFGNNVLSYATAGYFELDSQFKPLLHTWSLGVEEQYYIAIPLIIAGAFAIRGRRAVAAAIVLVTAVSFGACLWLSRANPNANFYLIFSRAWELGAGAIVTLIEPRLRASDQLRKYAAVLAAIGLALILAGVALIEPTASLPSWPTLIPIAGTCLVLGFGSTTGFAGRILAWRPMVFVGQISYSLYLYHQPVLVFARIASLEEPSLLMKVALLPVIFILSFLSWRYVETPFRDRTLVRIPLLVGSTGLASLGAAGVGLAFFLTSGFYANWPELAVGDPDFGMNQNEAFNMAPYRFAGAAFRDDGKPSVLVMGNSFARDFINMGLETGRLSNYQISYSDVGDCQYPLPPRLKTLAKSASFVVLGSGTSIYNIDCVKRRLAELRAFTSARLVVMGTKNFGWNNNAVMLLPAKVRYSYWAKPDASSVQDAAVARAALPSDVYVDVMGLISNAAGRVPVFTPDHKFISQDRRHLTKAGAKYIGDILFSRSVLRTMTPAS